MCSMWRCKPPAFQRMKTQTGERTTAKLLSEQSSAISAVWGHQIADVAHIKHRLYVDTELWEQTAGMSDEGNLDVLSDTSLPVLCVIAAAGRFLPSVAVMGPGRRWSQQTSALWLIETGESSGPEHPVARRCFVALTIGIRELKQGWAADGSRRSARG